MTRWITFSMGPNLFSILQLFVVSCMRQNRNKISVFTPRYCLYDGSTFIQKDHFGMYVSDLEKVVEHDQILWVLTFLLSERKELIALLFYNLGLDESQSFVPPSVCHFLFIEILYGFFLRSLLRQFWACCWREAIQ